MIQQTFDNNVSSFNFQSESQITTTDRLNHYTEVSSNRPIAIFNDYIVSINFKKHKYESQAVSDYLSRFSNALWNITEWWTRNS